MGTSKSSTSKNNVSQKTNPSDKITIDINEKEFNKTDNFTNIKD